MVDRAKTRTELCADLAEALRVWDQMNDDIEAMRYKGTKAQHDLQRQIVDSLVRELESYDDRSPK